MKQDVERWLPIKGWEGEYEISDQGRVKSLSRTTKYIRCGRFETRNTSERILRSCCNAGYRQVTLRAGGKKGTHLIHALVLRAFCSDRPPNMECRHLDGNRSNNTIKNLKWGTLEENQDDKKRHGNVLIGERQSMAKLKNHDIVAIRKARSEGITLKELSKKYGVAMTRISRIARRQNWAHVQ